MDVFTEVQWFDTFYPVEWGDWRVDYNIGQYRDNTDKTGCTWMDYKLTGNLLGEDEDGLIKVLESPYEGYLHHYFIEVGAEGDYLIPYHQPSVGKKYVSVLVEKQESNLDLFSIRIAGVDDCSYTKDFIGYDDTVIELNRLLTDGVSGIRQRDYYFTN